MYKEPWHAISDYPAGHEKVLLQELRKELAVNHPLFGLTVSVLAKREDSDDVLLEYNAEYYIVHLTWSGKVESEGYPIVKYFASRKALSEQLADDVEFF